MTRLLTRLVTASLIVLHMTSPAAARRVALVIGNASYVVGPLANPVNDAEAVAAALGRIGFDKVDLRKNLGSQDLKGALRDFGAEAVGAEIALVFFAGHGTENSGANYLVPVDARLARAADLELEAVRLDAVLGAIDGATKLRLVILDACRNTLFPLAGGKRTQSRGLAHVEPETNTLIAYAAKEGTVADDGGSGNHSPFTAALLKHIERPGLEVDYVFRIVRDEVVASTGKAQQPHLYGALGKERIYLRPPEASPVPPPPAASVPSDVERAWARIQNSDDIALLEAFRKQYGEANPFYDQLAARQIERVKRARAQAEEEERKRKQADLLKAAEVEATRKAIEEMEAKRKADAEALRLAAAADAKPKVHREPRKIRDLGLTLGEPSKIDGRTNGIRVSEVAARSDAAEKGILPGDILLHAGEKSVTSENDVAQAIEQADAAGRKAVFFKVAREGDGDRFIALRFDKSVDWSSLVAVPEPPEPCEGSTLDTKAEKTERDPFVIEPPSQFGFADDDKFNLYKKPEGQEPARDTAKGRLANGQCEFEEAEKQKDSTAAFKWLEKAAGKGHAGANFRLAEIFDGGVGATKSGENAARRLLFAAAGGHQAANEQLASDLGEWSIETRRALQDELKDAGHYDGKVDGKWGSGSQRAAKSYVDAKKAKPN